MKHLPIIVPIITTIVFTAVSVFLALWLTELVPPGEWAGLIKALLILFVVVCALVAIAWSAYFTWVIRRTLIEKK
jgi:membrane protease YdiL (CAAX protease family)